MTDFFFDPRENAATDAAARAVYPELATDAQLHAQSLGAMVDDAASLQRPQAYGGVPLVGDGGLGSVQPMTPEQYAALLAQRAQPVAPPVEHVPSELRPGAFLDGTTDQGSVPISPQEAQAVDAMTSRFDGIGERDYAIPVVTGPPRWGGPGMGD